MGSNNPQSSSRNWGAKETLPREKHFGSLSETEQRSLRRMMEGGKDEAGTRYSKNDWRLMFSPRDHHTDPETGITAVAGVKLTEYYTTLAHQGEYRLVY